MEKQIGIKMEYVKEKGGMAIRQNMI